MLIACLYSHWTPPVGAHEGDLWSFAAVTDEPPPEVADAGHDRCIIQLRPENAVAWLTPQERTLDELDEILDDAINERPYYEHRMAAWGECSG
ncbi:putative SOS response-associated peptidase YedK [Variovorax sp. W2I14]